MPYCGHMPTTRTATGYPHHMVQFDSQLDTCAKCGIVGPADTQPDTLCTIKS